MLDIAIDPSNPNIIYIAGAHGCNTVWKSTDGGANWTRKPGPFCDMSSVAIDPANPNTIYALNADNVIKSTDGASTWEIVLGFNHQQEITESNAPLVGFAIDLFNPNVVYASSWFSGVYKSTDAGINWTLLTGSPSTIVNGVITDPARADTLYAAKNTAYQSVNAGASWNSINTGFPGTEYSLLMRPTNDPDILYAGEWAGGGFYIYGLPSANQQPAINSLPNATIDEGDRYEAAGSFTDVDSTS